MSKTTVQVIGKGWCPHTKNAWKLSDTDAYHYERIDCEEASNKTTCALADGYPTFAINGKRCAAGMYPQERLDAKFEQCLAAEAPADNA